MSDTTCSTNLPVCERIPNALIHEQAAALKSSHVLQQIFDNSPALLAVLNEQRQIVFCNTAFARAVGAVSMDDVLGKRPGEAIGCIYSGSPSGCGTAEACSTCGAFSSIAVAQGGRGAQGECRITSMATGQETHFDFSASSVPIQVGPWSYVVFSLTDISHEKRRRALEQIFFHDVLNKASGMQGLAELLTHLLPVGQPAEVAEHIRSTAATLIEEINSQHQLAAAENNELAVTPKPLQTVTMIRQVVGSYRAHPAAEGKTIQIDPDSMNVEFVTDGALLGRVLGNMLKNALEASAPGHVVTLGCRGAESGSIEFWVHNPTPIPHKVQLQVFQRSFSTKGLGRGLGTYSMKLLTNRYLGGSVSFTSDDRTGTEFAARFPRFFVPR